MAGRPKEPPDTHVREAMPALVIVLLLMAASVAAMLAP